MVNPGGTGRPMLAISARLAPLPPSRFFISLLPSALPPPKKNVRLPPVFTTGFATRGLAGLALAACLPAPLRGARATRTLPAAFFTLLACNLILLFRPPAVGPSTGFGFGFRFGFTAVGLRPFFTGV